jgi:hypothetical protein
MLKQPSGTNHFQFRLHQFGFAVEEIGGGFCSTQLFYFEREDLCNRSLRCALSVLAVGSIGPGNHPQINLIESLCLPAKIEIFPNNFRAVARDPRKKGRILRCIEQRPR